MPDLPSGTVTFLFTDIEDSTALWERDRAAMAAVVDRHLAHLRSCVRAHGGVLYKTVGDGTQSAFAVAPDALAAAVAAQQALRAEPWPELHGSLRVRMALHAGEATPQDADYLAAPLNRLARLLDIGHGGHVLLTQAVQQLVRDDLPHGVALRDLGEHHLRDLEQPDHIFQVLHPDLLADNPPLLRPRDRRHRLPATFTPFLGRSSDLGILAGWLCSQRVRLLTLTGPGGVGKTRLAIQVAEAVADDFSDGVVFVDLAAVTDFTLVPAAIATALEIRDQPGRTLMETVAEILRDRRLLLILDNFEHLLEATQTVMRLLETAPGLKILATSRTRLNLVPEQEYSVAPLKTPGLDALPGLGSLEAFDAVRLFVSRAQAYKPDFQITPENASAIASICIRLDGLPLAIELAAARVKVLPPPALLARLERRLPLLTGGSRNLPARQRTLRDAIAWSYDLLDGEEQDLLRRLSAFVGGWTLEAAEAVVGLDSGLDVLGGLGSLVDKSLVRVEEDRIEPRYSMLETIREFALERLRETGQDLTIRDCHAAFYLSLAETAEPQLIRADQQEWLDRLEADRANLTAVLGWFLEKNHGEEGLRLAAALKRFWAQQGPYAEATRWLAIFLQPAESVQQIRARALEAAGFFAHWEGHYEQSLTYYQEALAIFRQLGDTNGEAQVLQDLGSLAIDQGDRDHAQTLLRQSRAIAERAGDLNGVAGAIALLGVASSAAGDHEQAGVYFAEAADRYRALGNVASLVDATGDGGYVAALRGDLITAEGFLAESLPLADELDYGMRVGWALMSLGHVAAAKGSAAQAVRFLAAAGTTFKTIGEVMRPSAQDRYDQALAEQRQLLGEAAFAAAWEQGHRLSRPQAVTEGKAAMTAISLNPG
jgi:predicted ATPase/class 3 adenylate cyclase